jgi:hypothetical protein
MDFQIVEQDRFLLIAHGKGADTTIADYLGRHSLQYFAFGKGVSKDGEVGMGVDVDKTRGGHEAIRFNDRFASAFYGRRDLCDHSVLDGNISPEGLPLRTVDGLCTPDEECRHTNNFAI